jgi:uncharacterized protein YoxC
MLVTVDLLDLLLTLLILIGATLGVFLIVFLVRLIKTLKSVSRLTTDLYDPLKQTIGQLPGLLLKFDGISKDVAELTKSTNESVPVILADAKVIASSARAGVEAVGSAAESVGFGVSSLFGSDREQPGSLDAIIGIVSQILQIVGLFTNRGNPAPRKPGSRSARSKKRRR